MAERLRREYDRYHAHKHAYDALEARRKDSFDDVKLTMRDLMNIYKDLVAHMPALRNKLERIGADPKTYEDLYRRLLNVMRSAISGLSFIATPRSKLQERDALREDYLNKQEAFMNAMEKINDDATKLFTRLRRVPAWQERLDKYIARVKQATAAEIIDNLQKLRPVLARRNMDELRMIDRIVSFYNKTFQRRIRALDVARKRLERIPSERDVARYLDTGFRALGGVEKIAKSLYDLLNRLDRVWETKQKGKLFRDLNIYADLHKLIPGGSEELCSALRNKIHLAMHDEENVIKSFEQLEELTKKAA